MRQKAVSVLVRTAVLAALALAFQSLGLHQYITGPVINAILYVAALFISPWTGVAVGIITPWAAFLVGIMKFAPVIPVIIAGNVSLALVSGYVGRYQKHLGLGLAAVVKFLVMTGGIKYLIMTGTKVPAPVYAAMTLTQLFTALIGAVVALAVLEGLKTFDAKRRHEST